MVSDPRRTEKGNDVPSLLNGSMTLTPRLSWMALPLMAGDRRSKFMWSEPTGTDSAQGQEESCVRVKGGIDGVVWGLLLNGAALLHGVG